MVIIVAILLSTEGICLMNYKLIWAQVLYISGDTPTWPSLRQDALAPHVITSSAVSVMAQKQNLRRTFSV